MIQPPRRLSARQPGTPGDIDIDPRGEKLILEMLQHELPDATLLTISFHSALEPLHHRKIVLNRLTETRHLFQVKRENSSSPH